MFAMKLGFCVSNLLVVVPDVKIQRIFLLLEYLSNVIDFIRLWLLLLKSQKKLIRLWDGFFTYSRSAFSIRFTFLTLSFFLRNTHSSFTLLNYNIQYKQEGKFVDQYLERFIMVKGTYRHLNLTECLDVIKT